MTKSHMLTVIIVAGLFSANAFAEEMKIFSGIISGKDAAGAVVGAKTDNGLKEISIGTVDATKFGKEGDALLFNFVDKRFDRDGQNGLYESGFRAEGGVNATRVAFELGKGYFHKDSAFVAALLTPAIYNHLGYSMGGRLEGTARLTQKLSAHGSLQGNVVMGMPGQVGTGLARQAKLDLRYQLGQTHVGIEAVAESNRLKRMTPVGVADVSNELAISGDRMMFYAGSAF